jgi:hypothetical protein
MAKTKINGILSVVNLERDKERTNFYIENENGELKKHSVFLKWIKDGEGGDFLFEGYWYIMRNNKKMSGGECDREWQEKSAVKMILRK